MVDIIKNKEELNNILLGQIKSWWGDVITLDILTRLIGIYNIYMKDDMETNQIIRTVKELFRKNIDNPTELSKLIDEYLIPKELERKINAEISTPYNLRQKMLEKIPNEFWKTTKTVFEPCCGKGGFVLDIINKFMDGMKNSILNKTER